MTIEPRVGTRRVSVRSRLPREKESSSPYFGLGQDQWAAKTRELIQNHPVDLDELVSVVMTSWNSIFESSIGSGFKIGTHIFPRPQVLGFLIHELVPLEFERLSQGLWRRDSQVGEKDLVYSQDESKSIEIKTSSSPNQIFGNRSFGQQGESQSKKVKTGYYLAINFERWDDATGLPLVRLIRFGWLDHSDWNSQTKSNGQQASLAPFVENVQMLTVYDSRDLS